MSGLRTFKQIATSFPITIIILWKEILIFPKNFVNTSNKEEMRQDLFSTVENERK